MRVRFTIRVLLWLMLVVAILVAWWLSHTPRENRGQFQAILEPGEPPVMMDTATGRRWEFFNDGWREVGRRKPTE